MAVHHQEYSRHPKKNNAAQIPVILAALQQQLINALQKTVCTKSNAHSQDLNKALDFASNYDNITTEERNIIIHAKNSILIHKHIPWQKKGNATFDVTMGSYDGAETCELVGSFLLSQLQDLNINVGLYRDDGLATTPRDTKNIKKEICSIFNNNRLCITIEANKQIINFVDVTFNRTRSP